MYNKIEAIFTSLKSWMHGLNKTHISTNQLTKGGMSTFASKKDKDDMQRELSKQIHEHCIAWGIT